MPKPAARRKRRSAGSVPDGATAMLTVVAFIVALGLLIAVHE